MAIIFRRFVGLAVAPRTHTARRSLATANSGSMHVFNRSHVRMHRARAAMAEDVGRYDWLSDHLAAEVVERLEDVRKDFPLAVDLGCGGGHILRELQETYAEEDERCVGGIEELVCCDISPLMLAKAQRVKTRGPDDVAADGKTGMLLGDQPPPPLPVAKYVCCDEEALPFADNSVDLFVSSMSLHWVNDLPGTMAQIYRCLKPDGVLLMTMLGGATLSELRTSFVLAEQERDGGVSPHMSPLVAPGDAGSLLSNAGFQLVTVDTDKLFVRFEDATVVWEHMQGMGASNATLGRRSGAHPDTLLASAAAYQYLYGHPEDASGEYDEEAAATTASEGDALADDVVTATFQPIFLIGWKPLPPKEVEGSSSGLAGAINA